MTNPDRIRDFWDSLYGRDWDAIASFFGPTSFYFDVPVGEEAGARGPANIVARLKLGIEPLESFGHDVRTLVVDGAVAVTEHVEHWHFPTGEKVSLPFVSMMDLDGETIVRWADYWDYAGLMDGAPDWWHERLATADLSWME